ncbi:MAG: hypothetical protein MASP_01024 [Candidatus Methanolliviera sp. GoM_asphalt]|nr:MAG: hypothetical protein MASP_01024 [Candidatus Methanolliviera sp. GoM_asphalt]
MIVQVEDVEGVKDKTVDRWGRLVGFADWRGSTVKVLKIKGEPKEFKVVDEKEENDLQAKPNTKKKFSILGRR